VSKNQALLSDQVAASTLSARPVETDTDLFFMFHSENFFWPMGWQWCQMTLVVL